MASTTPRPASTGRATRSAPRCSVSSTTSTRSRPRCWPSRPWRSRRCSAPGTRSSTRPSSALVRPRSPTLRPRVIVGAHGPQLTGRVDRSRPRADAHAARHAGRPDARPARAGPAADDAAARLSRTLAGTSERQHPTPRHGVAPRRVRRRGDGSGGAVVEDVARHPPARPDHRRAQRRDGVPRRPAPAGRPGPAGPRRRPGRHRRPPRRRRLGRRPAGDGRQHAAELRLAAASGPRRRPAAAARGSRLRPD